MATSIPRNEAAFTQWELAVACDGDLTRLADDGAPVVGVVTDSRGIGPGNVFVAVHGDSFDGHDFLAAAIDRGASALVVERGRSVPPGRVAVVEVDDTLSAFGGIARAHVRRWRRTARATTRVGALTGSAGKTTTKELVAAILSVVDGCLATAGNLNNRVGVPSMALCLQRQRYAVFELGMSVPGEIGALAGIVEPDVAALLNVGVAHAEGFGGSRAGIAREKGAIFDGLAAAGVAVVNLDDAAARAQVLRTRARVVGFGVSSDADVRLVRREALGVHGSRLTVDRAGSSFEVSLPVAGEAAALDLVAAVAITDAMIGTPVPADRIAEAMAAWRPIEGRSSLVELAGDILVVDDSYNANPASMRAALATLDEVKRAAPGRAIAVLGEMRELGALSLSEHESLGEELARHPVDVVIGCGGAIDATLRCAEERGLEVKYARNAEDAGALVAGIAQAGDVVLFKGSRGATVERALAVLVARHPRLTSRPGGAP